MVNIFDDLAGVGLPVYQQGAAPQTKDLPDEFLTVWEDPSEDILHADNKAQQLRQTWTLIFYTRNKANIYSGLRSVIDFLKAKNYIINGQGGDVSGSWENYDARGVDVVKIVDMEV